MFERAARRARQVVLALVVAGVMLSGAVAPAWADRTGEVALEVGLLRPLGFIRLVVGVPFFGVSVPFLLIGGQGLGESRDLFIMSPYEDTFERDLGDF